MTETKKGRGGWRGGGRPKTNRVTMTVRLDLDVVEILSKFQRKKSDYINIAVRHYNQYIQSRIEEAESIE